MFKFKNVLCLLVVTAIMFSLTACGGSSKKTVNMLYWPGPETEAMQKVVDAYNTTKGQKDAIEVKLAPAPREGFWEKESAMMGANNKDIDIYMTASYKVGEHQDYLIPLDDKLNGAFKLFIGSLVDSLKVDGKTYAVPMDVSNHFMYYRKDLVEKLLSDAGQKAKYKEISKNVVGKELEPKDPKDWNWDDFTATAAFFSKKYNTDSPTEYGTALPAKNLIYNIMLWDNVLYSFGGSWYDKSGKANFNTPETVKALNVYANIMKKGLSPASSTTFEYAETNQALETGNAVLALQWSAAYHELTDKSKNAKYFDKIAIAPIPGEKHFTHVHALAVGINKNSKNIDASVKFMQYLCTKDSMQMYADNGGIPSVSEVLNNLKDKRPEFPAIAEHCDKYGMVEDTSKNVFPILNVLATNFSSVWAGLTDAESGAKKAQDEVSALLGKK